VAEIGVGVTLLQIFFNTQIFPSYIEKPEIAFLDEWLEK